MARRRRGPARGAKPSEETPDEADPAPLTDELLRALRELFTIPGVEGVGQPVTIISPADLPIDFLGFVERLRADAIEVDEEMVLLTIPAVRGRRRDGHPTTRRLRESLRLLCRHALDSGVPSGDVMTLLDDAKWRVGTRRPKG